MGTRMIVHTVLVVASLAALFYGVWTNIGPESALFMVGGLVGSVASTLVVMRLMSIRVYYTPPPHEHSIKIVNPEHRIARH